MQPFRYHVFACEQQKGDGIPCCAARGAARTIDALRREVAKEGLAGDVQITACGSIGLCERGPNLVVYPEGVWYSGVRPEDVPELVTEHFRNGRVVERLANKDQSAVRSEIETNRDRYLAAMKMMDAAGVVPEPVMAIARAFQPSRVLLTGIELNVFTAIGSGATAAEVATRIGGDARATAMLLDALVALEFLTKRDGKYSNGPAAARWFVAGSPDDSRDALMHSVNAWRRWNTLTEAVRTGTSVDGFNVGERDEDWLRAFIGAMQEGAKLGAAPVARAVGTDGVGRMLDIGGGSGAYSIAFVRESETLEADILDLEAVVPITHEYVERAGLSSRVRAIPGDLRQESYGGPYDLVLISSIAHMLSPEDNVAMFRKAHAALAPGGRIVVREFLLDPDRTSPRFSAMFALNMLVATTAGNAFTEAELKGWLEEAGFTSIERLHLHGPADLLVARRA